MDQVKDLIDHIKLTNRCGSWQSSSFRFLCPYCQTGSKDRKGREYTPGKAKGYIYQYKNGTQDLWAFKCHRIHCPSGKSISILKLILDHYPELLARDQIEALAAKKARKSNPASRFSGNSLALDPELEPKSLSTPPIIQQLPRSTPQHQAGKGSFLEQRLKARKTKKQWWEKDLPPLI